MSVVVQRRRRCNAVFASGRSRISHAGRLLSLGLFTTLSAIGCSADGIVHSGVGLPTQLIFLTQPESVKAGVAIAPSIAIAVADAKGHIVHNASDTIIVSLAHDEIGGLLTGTLVRPAVNGVADFTDLAVDKPWSYGNDCCGYALSANARGLASATSQSVYGDYGPAAKLVFSLQPKNTISGAAFYVAVDVTDPAGDFLRNSAAKGYSLTASATDDGLVSATSASFDVLPKDAAPVRTP
jgi:hypothetical protein